MPYVPVAAPVYGSVTVLEQFASPQTSSRYAVIPGLGMFAWYPQDTSTRNGTTVLGTGVVGRWKLSDTFGNGSVWKQACFVAADSNVTLSGTQTIDGQSVTAGKVVFCTAQTAPAENGPWTCAAGAWSRPSWFDAAADAQSGAVFPVIAGTTYGGSLWMLTSPTSGTITPGTTAITVEQVSGDGGVVDTALALPLTLSQNQTINASSTAGELSIQRAASGHVAGKRTTIYIAAYSTVTVLYLSADLNVYNSATGAKYVPTDFDADLTTVIELTQVSATLTIGEFKQIARPDTSAPSIKLCIVPKSDTDTLEIHSDEGIYVSSTSGITLTSWTGTPKTITGIKSGNGTTRLILQLSGAILTTDVFNVTFAANAACDLSSNAFPAQDVAFFWYTLPSELSGFTCYRSGDVELVSGTWSPPTGYTDSATIIQVNADRRPSTVANAYDGATALRFAPLTVTFDNTTDVVTTTNVAHGITTVDTPVVFTLPPDGSGVMPTGLSVDTTYYARTLTTSTLQLAAAPAGAAINFTTNGSGTIQMHWQTLPSSSLLSAFVSNTTDTCWCAFVPKKIPSNPAAGYDRDMVLGSQTYWGITVAKGVGSDTCTLGAHEFTSGDDKIDVSIVEASPVLARRRHAAGTMGIRADRGTEATVASGNVASVGNPIIVGSGKTDKRMLECDVFALLTTNAAQSSTDLEGIESFFTLQAWGGFLRHDNIEIPPVKVIAGDAAEVYWDQVHQTNNTAQYTYVVTGVSGSSTTTKWSWTTAGGDVGSYTATVVVKLGGRPVATRTFTVQVVSATSAANVKVLHLGDSWTNGGIFPDRTRSRLVSAGCTVTMQGSRGGYTCSFDHTTDRINQTAHGHVDGDRVHFVTELPSGVLPAALSTSIEYYVVNKTTNDFQVSLTLAGSPVLFADNGTGTNYAVRANQRNEGRGGETAADFYYSNRESLVGVSPFKDVGTLGTGRFSWSYYKSTWLSGVAPTDIPLQLGINAIVNGGYLADGTGYTVDHNDPASVDVAIDYHCGIVERMIAEIHAVDPTVRFHLLAPSKQNALQSSVRAAYHYALNREPFVRSVQRFNRRLLAQFGGRTAEKIYLVGLAHVNTAADFGSGDFFHIGASYSKVGDAVAASILAEAS